MTNCQNAMQAKRQSEFLEECGFFEALFWLKIKQCIMRITLTILSLAFIFHALLAQSEAAVMDVGRLRVHISEDGSWGSNEQAFLEWRKDNGEYVSLLQKGGLHFGGVDLSSNLEVAVMDGTSNRAGFWEPQIELTGVFRVSREEILAHLADYEDNQNIDNPIPAIYAWPGVGNPFFFENTGQELPMLYYGAANFWDEDSDGMYNPDGGDTPFFDYRENPFCGPESTPAELYWLSFTVAANPLLPNVPNLQIYTQIAHFGCANGAADELLNRSIIINSKIINFGTEVINNVRFGHRFRSALGNTAGDALATNPELGHTYFYELNGEDEAFGSEAVPTVSIAALSGPLNEMGEQISIDGVLPEYLYANGPAVFESAENTIEAYNLISGIWKDNTSLTSGGNGYDPNGTPTRWAFPGLPGSADWNFEAVSNPPQQVGYISSFPAFSLLPGAVNEVMLAVIVGNEGETLADVITGLDADTDALNSLFAEDGLCNTQPQCNPSSVTSETVVPALAVTISPNPVSNQLNVQLDEEIASAKIFIRDATGRLWLQSSYADGGQIRLLTANLPGGVYLLTVQTAAGQRTLRFVKSK